MSDDDERSYVLGRRPYRVDSHDPQRRVETPGWRAAQLRLISAFAIVVVLIVLVVYVVVFRAA